MKPANLPSQYHIAQDISEALNEDIQTGDITAELIDAEEQANARVITREKCVIAGQAWVNEAFRQIDTHIKVGWLVKDGDVVEANTILFTCQGNARAILTAERTALNFLQTLCGTATRAKRYVDEIKHTQCKLLDTRKTIPGLRLAQKYASTCGGAHNHRIGLYDAFLIKENHINACGSIKAAVEKAKTLHPRKLIEVETENLNEVKQAIEAGAQRIMLDNFTQEQVKDALSIIPESCDTEISGNVTLDNIKQWAETGVNYISSGAITKHVTAIDLSLRFY